MKAHLGLRPGSGASGEVLHCHVPLCWIHSAQVGRRQALRGCGEPRSPGELVLPLPPPPPSQCAPGRTFSTACPEPRSRRDRW